MRSLLIIILLSSPFCGDAQICHDTLTFELGDVATPVELTIDTVNYHHNIWQIGHVHKPVFDTAYSGSRVIVTDTNNLYPPNDTSVFYLKVKNYCGFSLWLEQIIFSYKTDIKTGTRLKIEVAGQSMTWKSITDTPYLNNEWLYSDTTNVNSNTPVWKDFIAKIDEAPGLMSMTDTVYFRFTFISDTNTVTANGWEIDNVSFLFFWEDYVSPIEQKNMFDIGPNPTDGDIMVHVASNTQGDIVVYNVNGIVVYKELIKKESTLLKMSLPDGLYFIKYISDKGNITRKIVIKN